MVVFHPCRQSRLADRHLTQTTLLSLPEPKCLHLVALPHAGTGLDAPGLPQTAPKPLLYKHSARCSYAT